MADDVGLGEVWRGVQALQSAVSHLDGSTRAVALEVTALRVRLEEHIGQQTDRTTRRDDQCRRHDEGLAQLGDRVRVVEQAAAAAGAATTEGHRSWVSLVQAGGTLAAMVAAGWAIVRG